MSKAAVHDIYDLDAYCSSECVFFSPSVHAIDSYTDGRVDVTHTCEHRDLCRNAVVRSDMYRSEATAKEVRP